MPRESSVSIAVVRPGLLGTYGDGGNAMVLARRLEWRGIEATVIALDGSSTLPEVTDICLLGGGEDGAQAAVAADTELARSLKRAAAAGTVLLGICGGMQLLGEAFCGEDGRLVEGFGVVDCTTDARLPRRAVGEVVLEPDGTLGRLTGFENHSGATRLGADARPLGRILVGVGNDERSGVDGILAHRAVGTYLHGPVLARNPALADMLLSWVTGDLPALDLPEVNQLRAERLRAASKATGATRSVRRMRRR